MTSVSIRLPLFTAGLLLIATPQVAMAQARASAGVNVNVDVVVRITIYNLDLDDRKWFANNTNRTYKALLTCSC